MRSPGCIFFSQKNTAGPVRESTCPAMTADPVAPGRGLPVYQPATVVVLGTWRVPLRLRPRLMMGAFTPMAGMVSQTGLGGGGAADSEPGTPVRPDGTATGDGRAASRTAGAGEVRATTRPAVPAPAARSPALSIAADNNRACAPHAAEAQPGTRGRRATPGVGPSKGTPGAGPSEGETACSAGESAAACAGAAPAGEAAAAADHAEAGGGAAGGRAGGG